MTPQEREGVLGALVLLVERARQGEDVQDAIDRLAEAAGAPAAFGEWEEGKDHPFEAAEYDHPPTPPPMPAPLRLRQLRGDTVLWSEEQQRWVVGDDLGDWDPDQDEDTGLSTFAEGEWQPYEGPRGGKGWRRGEEIVYGPHRPGSAEHRQAQQQGRKAKREKEALALKAEVKEALGKPATTDLGWAPGTRQESRDVALVMLAGTGMQAEDMHRLVGTQGGSEVSVRAQPGYLGRHCCAVRVDHPAIDNCSRTLTVSPDGALVCANNSFFLRKGLQGGGFGMAQFSDQVRTLAAIGADSIETCAGKGGGMNGYYTWARFGYDTELKEGWRRAVPRMAERLLLTQGVEPLEAGKRANALGEAKTVQDLMASEDGRVLWKAKGYMESMSFDLSPGSRSLAVLNDYLQSKGKPPILVDPEKVAACKEARKQAMAELPQRQKAEAEKRAQEEARRQEERRTAAAAGLEHVRNAFQEQARRAGLDPAAIYQEQFIAHHEDDFRQHWSRPASPPDLQAKAQDPVELRRAALSRLYVYATLSRHAQRMKDPAHEGIHQVWADRARQEGIDPRELRTEAGDYPSSKSDDAEGIDFGYGSAFDAINRRRRAAGAPD
jgi:hypothetical protein